MICRAITLFFSLVFFSSFAGEIVQGPFKLAEGGSLVVEKSDDENYPIELVVKLDEKNIVADRYETDGAPPIVESVFFKKIKGLDNIITLVSWSQLHREERINGKSYQVYGYTYSNGKVTSNKWITNDPNLSGMDGEFNGELLYFKYKNAKLIKTYLDNKK